MWIYVYYIIWAILTIYLFSTNVIHQHIYIAELPVQFEENQNSHDTLIQSVNSKKYFILRNNTEAKYSKLGINWLKTLKNIVLGELNQMHEFKDLNKVLREENTIMIQSETGIITVSELEIFTLIWLKLNEVSRLDALKEQMKDCFENGELVCINGRVARYFSAMVKIVEGELGEPEITEKMMIEQALNDVEKKFKEFLEKTPKISNIYYKGGNDQEEEELTIIINNYKQFLRRYLKRSYPDLKKEKIEELIAF